MAIYFIKNNNQYRTKLKDGVLKQTLSELVFINNHSHHLSFWKLKYYYEDWSEEEIGGKDVYMTRTVSNIILRRRVNIEWRGDEVPGCSLF